MQRHDVGLLQQIRQRDQLDPGLVGPLVRQIGIVGQHPHPEGPCPPGDLGPDPAGADQSQRLAEQLHPLERAPLPLPGSECGVRLRDVPNDRQHQRDRVLGRRVDVAARRVQHDHPPTRRVVEVDVVDADARPPDHLQPVGRRQHVGADPGATPNDQRVVVADDLAELIALDPGAIVDLELLRRLEDVQPLRRDLVGKQNPVPTVHHHRHASTRSVITDSSACSNASSSSSVWSPMCPIRIARPFIFP